MTQPGPLRKLFAGGRLRSARSRLAENPTAQNYVALAKEHAQLGEMEEVQRVCAEGLDIFPGNEELLRLYERAMALEREDRTRELYRLLREAPRPALYRELCEILLSSGRVARAEESAHEWYNATGDGQAQLVRAEARLKRFFADRRREDGRLAHELLDSAEKLLPRDERVQRLKLQLYQRTGALKDARRAYSMLLELRPGDPELEAGFRSLLAMGDNAPNFDQALRMVEKSGRLSDEEQVGRIATQQAGSIRPKLKELASEPGVTAAIYVRGSTALVQGPKGATAERHARAVREVVQKSSSTARRLGLGQAFEVLLEGDFGSLLIAPSEMGSGALWCSQRVESYHRQGLLELAGIAIANGGEAA